MEPTINPESPPAYGDPAAPSLFPGVDLAYPIARESQELMIKRLDALDGRIQSVLSLAFTVTMAIPVIATGKGLSFRSPLFLAGVAFFLVGVVIGFAARLYGQTRVVSPAGLFEHYLHLPEWDFKNSYIYWAGEHFRQNNRLILLRARLLVAMSGCLAAEAVVLALWAASRF